jgi:hypothetical protein
VRSSYVQSRSYQYFIARSSSAFSLTSPMFWNCFSKVYLCHRKFTDWTGYWITSWRKFGNIIVTLVGSYISVALSPSSNFIFIF